MLFHLVHVLHLSTGVSFSVLFFLGGGGAGIGEEAVSFRTEEDQLVFHNNIIMMFYIEQLSLVSLGRETDHGVG